MKVIAVILVMLALPFMVVGAVFGFVYFSFMAGVDGIAKLGSKVSDKL